MFLNFLIFCCAPLVFVVLNSFLIKKLEKELIGEHQNLYYIISNLENEVIENVKHFVKDYKEAEFFLYIVNEEDLSCDLFDEIYYVNSEKDKILS